MIEPPDMYKNHVPAKWLDDVPKVVRNDQGVDEWVFQGEKTATPFGMAATVGWPREQCRGRSGASATRPPASASFKIFVSRRGVLGPRRRGC
jgi:hypothetical protein